MIIDYPTPRSISIKHYPRNYSRFVSVFLVRVWNVLDLHQTVTMIECRYREEIMDEIYFLLKIAEKRRKEVENPLSSGSNRIKQNETVNKDWGKQRTMERFILFRMETMMRESEWVSERERDLIIFHYDWKWFEQKHWRHTKLSQFFFDSTLRFNHFSFGSSQSKMVVVVVVMMMMKGKGDGYIISEIPVTHLS